MELALSLGNWQGNVGINNINNNNMGFCMGLGLSRSSNSSSSEKLGEEPDNQPPPPERREKVGSATASPPRLQLDLLPLTPLPRHSQPPPPLRFPWLADNVSPEPDSSDGPGSRTVDVNRQPAVGITVAEEAEEADEQSSPNSGTSSFMEFSLYTSSNNKRENVESGNNYGQEMMMMMVGGGGGIGVTTSRGSDDEENGSTRKKLRLSKEQSAFLEESFKEHHTLNPKQKLALAKQLNLRPRQVEVWFQNRRARTKLKQTEVDCEYLKRCCETLTEDNRRLQKELQELRALKTSQPFFMHLPATTLTMCPSCERVAPTSAPPSASSTTTVAAKAAASPPSATAPGAVTLSLGKSKPILQTQIQTQTESAS